MEKKLTKRQMKKVCDSIRPEVLRLFGECAEKLQECGEESVRRLLVK